jgi:hypothetical protein
VNIGLNDFSHQNFPYVLSFKKPYLRKAKPLLMRSILCFGFLLFFASSCSIYTQSNVERVSKKNEKDLTNTFTPINHLDVTDGYNFGMVAAPLLVAHQDFTARGTKIPLGLEALYTQEKFGELNGHLFYMVGGFSLPKGDLSGIQSVNWRIKPNIMCAHWIWKRVETIDRYKISLGRYDSLHYTAILPVNVSIELALRGGYEKQLIEFVSPSLDQYMDQNYPANTTTYMDKIYHQMNGMLKFGLAFQRKMSTTFDADIDGKRMKAMEVSYKSVYFDVSYLIQPDNSSFYVDPDHDRVISESSDFVPTAAYPVLQQRDIMPAHPLGFCIGFQNFTRPEENLLGASMHVELGIAPGNYDKMINGLYGKFGFSLGIFPARFRPRKS